MRSGTSKTAVMIYFLWLHLNSCSETLGAEGAVADLVEACPSLVTVPLLLGLPELALP